ncbi:hypothetical protein K488DRAFT_88592 [Vararia minispora EC-137]|uniref:Uncharacterized protein n=1 Tax=Vararia minispora EC-137 TaxID=1314806 RepID=A0ACB8QCR8_9AGAM|nr:hypothetical protein K488DRAFT_88592 [Vararia minispora EC-137]
MVDSASALAGPVVEVPHNTFAIDGLRHVCLGIVLWELASTVWYEWEIFSGKRRQRWTFWVYFGVRTGLLFSYVCLLVQQDGAVTDPGNCQAAFIVLLAFSYFTFALASLIIVFRAVAIWNHSAVVNFLAYGVWLASIVLNVRDLFLARATYDPQAGLCVPLATRHFLVNLCGILGSDLALLGIMLLGLLRRQEAHFGVARFLYFQGIAWLALACTAEIPTVVLTALDISDTWNMMFHPLQLVTLCVLPRVSPRHPPHSPPPLFRRSICASRMYRALTGFGTVMTFSTVPADETGIRFRMPARVPTAGPSLVETVEPGSWTDGGDGGRRARLRSGSESAT